MPTKATKPNNRLLAALEFISCAQRANGNDMQRYCMLHQFAAVAFDGLIAAGSAIDEDLQCCPQTGRLVAALENCKAGYTISHVAMDRLVVQSGEFQASIPLANPAQMQWALPDPMIVVATDTVKAALKAVVGVVNEKADRVHESSVCLQSLMCLASNGNVVLEAWHGIDLPPNILLPKAAINALIKARKPLVGIGYGDTTVTFWFGDQSWIRTQRYLADWPKTTLLDTRTEPTQLPSALFSAMAQLAPFSEDGQLYCRQGKARSHPFAKIDAFNGQLVMDVEGINESRVYQLLTLGFIQPFAKLYDDTAVINRTFVYGDADVKLGTRKSEIVNVRMRGVFSHATENVANEPPPLPPVGGMSNWSQQLCADCNFPMSACDCVPF